MVKAVFEELDRDTPRGNFTVGIHDDVSHSSLEVDDGYVIEDDATYRAVFYGLGSDGTVGANKNTIKILGQDTELHAQGYFVYDSKKSGSQTVSHLRFGRRPIRSAYLVQQANLVGCHQFGFVGKTDVLRLAAEGAVFLLNSPYGADAVWDQLPEDVRRQIVDKKLRFHVIDAFRVAKTAGLGQRINTIMQVAFFKLSGVLPPEEAIERIKAAIRKTYGRKGATIVAANLEAVDRAAAAVQAVVPPEAPGRPRDAEPVVDPAAPEFVREVTARMIAGRGDELPVSALPADGTWPVGTSAWERRVLSLVIEVWEPDL